MLNILNFFFARILLYRCRFSPPHLKGSTPDIQTCPTEILSLPFHLQIHTSFDGICMGSQNKAFTIFTVSQMTVKHRLRLLRVEDYLSQRVIISRFSISIRNILKDKQLSCRSVCKCGLVERTQTGSATCQQWDLSKSLKLSVSYC